MPTHTRLSLQPKSREPRKTAGGIRGQRKAGVRRQTAVTAMPLKMRPTGLGSGIDKDRADYTVFTGEWEVGRIYETRGGPDNLRWFWSVTVNGPMTRSDRVATLEEAKAQFQKSWDAWKKGAKLEEID
jgi:hypothetical protein